MRVERCIPNVLIVLCIVCDLDVSGWYGVYHSFMGVVNGCGRMRFFIYDGDGISEWYEIIIFSWKVVSVYLLTDRNYVFKS